MSEDNQQPNAVKLIQQVHQGLYGVPGTAEGGVVADVKEIKKTLGQINGTVKRNAERSLDNEARLEDHIINHDKQTTAGGMQNNMPYKEKWFWILIIGAILLLSGVANIPNLVTFFGGIS